jgi:CRISPR/Cas system CMR subunit Cmr4 (Cas7 group RAMP superfamily)
MSKLNHRYIARVVLQAETPLFVGSGESSLLKDALVQKDNHGFPMIQGTSLAGVLRHAIEDAPGVDKTGWQSFFGYQSPKGKKGEGSQLKVSSAYLILTKGKIAEGLSITDKQRQFINTFENLPVRQHVRITDKGVAKENGLFDNEVVYKGTRFLFELELKGSEEDKGKWKELIAILQSQKFRIGQGTRNGYGQLSMFSIKAKEFDLSNEVHFNEYLNYNPSLNFENKCLESVPKINIKSELTHYKLIIKPDDFFSFSAGYGDDEVDNIPVTEQIISYDSNNTMLVLNERGQTLIPATSVKGALSHRTAFYYNKKKKYFAEKYNDKVFLEYIETNNKAIYELFGAQEGVDDRDKENKYAMHEERNGKRGKVIINDVFLSRDMVSSDKKIFNHVAIDRFTGGAMDGALFSEKVSYFNDKENTMELNIYVEPLDDNDKTIEQSFEEALKDICKGLLPLGGMTTKGHGMFTGKLFKNEEEVFSYE